MQTDETVAIFSLEMGAEQLAMLLLVQLVKLMDINCVVEIF